jgi:hypothetical protein
MRLRNLGLKVFMDAHSTVTAEEGDRYPLGPPDSLQGHSLPQTLATGVTVEERPEPYKNTLSNLEFGHGAS